MCRNRQNCQNGCGGPPTCTRVLGLDVGIEVPYHVSILVTICTVLYGTSISQRVEVQGKDNFKGVLDGM